MTHVRQLIASIDRLTSPPGLSGREGRYRLTPDQLKIDVADDLDAVRAWLNQHKDVPATWRSYRSAAEKLLNWAWFRRGIAVSSMGPDDFSAFFSFLLSPEPEEDWVSGHSCHRGAVNWTPFKRPEGNAGARGMAYRLRSLTEWMRNIGYADLRPKLGLRDLSESGSTCNLSMLTACPPRSRQSIKPSDWLWIEASLSSTNSTLLDRLVVYLVHYAQLLTPEIERLRESDFFRRPGGSMVWRIRVSSRAKARRWIYALPPLADALNAWFLRNDRRAFDGSPHRLLELSCDEIRGCVHTTVIQAAELARVAGDFDAGARLEKARTVALRYLLETRAPDQEIALWVLLGVYRRAGLAFLKYYVPSRELSLSSDEVCRLFHELDELFSK